jgi:aminoglycoside 2'-N-acetyltransferase I
VVERLKWLISHGSLVERTLVCSSQTLNVGYVEAVATAPAHRDKGFYETLLGELAWADIRGWSPRPRAHAGRRWRCHDLRTSRSPRLDLDGDIVCDWRSGDVW